MSALEPDYKLAWEAAEKRLRQVVAQRDTAMAIVAKVAAIPIWRDVYHDGPDVVDTNGGRCLFSPDEIRVARSLMEN